jgi:DNA-binding FrmR family transcriptional regulator
MALVDAATIVVGVPTVLAGPHPLAAYATLLANALRPKAKFLSIIGSYGWGGKTVETLAGMIPNLKVEVLEPVLCKGVPAETDFEALDKLAGTKKMTIAEKAQGAWFPYMYLSNGGLPMPLCGDDHPKLIARINRIEGQVRGLKKMIEEDRDCLQVLKQIAAAGGALRSLGAVILEDHLKGCVATAIQTHDNESQMISEVIEIFNKFTK